MAGIKRCVSGGLRIPRTPNEAEGAKLAARAGAFCAQTVLGSWDELGAIDSSEVVIHLRTAPAVPRLSGFA